MPRLRPSDAARRARAAAPEFSEALARGLAVVTAFDAGARRLSLSEVATRIDLPRATARRALLTLVQLGYAESDGKRFALTPQVLRLAGAWLTAGAAAVLQRACERLAREVGEACSAAVRDGGDAVMIAHAGPARFLGQGAGVGFRLPAFSTALGRVLLAGLDDAALDDFLARLAPVATTARTVTDRTALRRLVLKTRAQGWCFADQEAEAGFRSIAVPVRRYDGAVAAALNIGVRIEAATPEVMRKRFLPRLLEVARALDGQLV
jgi:IclR family pca regulon transcriptional regulator